MQNKNRYILIGIGVIVLAAAAYLGGQLLNGQGASLGLLPFGGGRSSGFSINITPAPDVPTTDPIVTGNFIERKDNTIFVSSQGMVTFSGGGTSVISISKGSPGESDGGDQKNEVVITSNTKILRDTSDIGALLGNSGNKEVTMQQTVEEGSLDEFTTSTMVSIWGRKNGDRIIADTIVYMNPVIIQK